MKRSLLLFFFGFVCGIVQESKAQSATTHYQLPIAELKSPITLDGKLEEPCWLQAEVATQFYMNFPADTAYAQGRTEVKMLFDQTAIYLAATVYSQTPEQAYIVSSLRRDFNARRNDCFSVVFDPFRDGLNGFVFSVSAYGVQREGLIANGNDIDASWDNRWFSKVTRSPEKWTVEMMIPFTTLRFPPNTTEWGVNFIRFDQQINEYSSWKPVPVNFGVENLAFTGIAQFENPLPNPGMNMAFIPYVSSNISKDHAEGQTTNYKANAGFDAKVAVTPSLNLDLTFNPDFSQVEVDQQVTNLQRFEIFFPERRQFFIENSDLFGQFGFSRSTPFFSRRIGIGEDTVSETTVQTPILYGARLSGKLNRDWRIGLLNMQTAKDEEKGILAQNYSVAAIQRQVFSRSNIGMIFVNRQGFETPEEADKYTRVVGLDYNLNSADGKWEGDFWIHRAFKPTQSDKRFAHGGFLRYATRKLNVFWVHEYIQEDYDINDIGFIRRTGISRARAGFNYRVFPKNSNGIAQHQFSARYGTFMTESFELLDRNAELEYEVLFTNQSQIGVLYTYDWITLTDPFDPTNTEGLELPEGSLHSFGQLRLQYNTDPRKLFNAQVNTSYGTYFNGERFRASGSFNYRFQPFGQFAINIDYNKIELPEQYNDAELWLVGTRLDLSFTRSLFLSSFMQYNRQSENINHNVRLQWRFHPVSDLFIVYTDNYLPQDFTVKNRALIMKLSYWLPI